MGKKFTVDMEMRLRDQLLDLVEAYELGNVKNVLEQIISEKPGEMAGSGGKLEQTGVVKRGLAEEGGKANLPPNAKNLEEFVKYASQLQKDKVREYVLNKLRDFVNNVRLIETGNLKQVDESFVIGLTEKEIINEITTPEEDWLDYNASKLKKKIKAKLRLSGYEFLDSDFEVGKRFDPKKHNCIGTQQVDSQLKDKRVIKVVNEGLIIESVLHINANVIVGKFKP